jgi:TMEM175 potassium channel family protein
VFRHLADHHEGLAWWNFAFLFTITAIPFTSSLLGQYGSNPLAVDIFAVNLLLATLATRAILLYGRRRDLLAGKIDPRAVQALRGRAAGMVIIVALSVSLAWVNTSIAKDFWLLIPLVQWAAGRWSARAPQPKARPAHLASSLPRPPVGSPGRCDEQRAGADGHRPVTRP